MTYEGTGPNDFDTVFTNNNRYNYYYNLTAGHYTLKYTDAAGCRGTQIIDLHEPEPLAIEGYELSFYNDIYTIQLL